MTPKCLICGGDFAGTPVPNGVVHLECLQKSWHRLLTAVNEAQCLLGGERYEEAALKLMDAVPKASV